MTYTLDDLRAALATTPQEREYVEVWADAWSPAEKDAGRDLLLAAASAGDHRAPLALTAVASGDALRVLLEDLLVHGPPRVRVEAGWALQSQRRALIEQALGPAIHGAQLDRHGLLRSVDLLIAMGSEALLVAILDATPHEDARSMIIERLWNARGLGNFASVWWTGLGLLKRTLTLELASFRGAALERFKKVLVSTPALEGYQPVPAGTPIPSGLKTAMDDVDRGQGPVAPALVGALSDGDRHALLVYAADVALHRSKARGVTYVAYLAGVAHRDLLDWAAAHRIEAIAEAGAAALRALALPG